MDRNRYILKYIIDNHGMCGKGKFKCNDCPLALRAGSNTVVGGCTDTFERKYKKAMKICASRYPDIFLEKAL